MAPLLLADVLVIWNFGVPQVSCDMHPLFAIAVNAKTYNSSCGGIAQRERSRIKVVEKEGGGYSEATPITIVHKEVSLSHAPSTVLT